MPWIIDKIRDILPNRPYGKTAKDTRVARLVDLNRVIDSVNQGFENLSGPSYKVYTALLTQSGSDVLKTISFGSVVQGVSYNVVPGSISPGPAYDFSNVGGPVFPENWSFVATSSSEPISWNGVELQYNTGAPVVTVLENTIGDVYWTRTGIGMYDSISNGNFTINKTFILVSVENGLTWQVSPSPYGDGDKIYFEAGTSDVYTDGVIFQVEIRVYN